MPASIEELNLNIFMRCSKNIGYMLALFMDAKQLIFDQS